MTRIRLITLFSTASLISIAIFTLVTYYSHVDAVNLQNLSYLRLYVEQLNEHRLNGKSTQNIPLPYHIIQDSTYQIIVYHQNAKNKNWLKPQPWFSAIKGQFPFELITTKEEMQGHINIHDYNIHWIKLPLQHPDASIFFLHQDSDHWQSFNKNFGLPIILFGILLLWAAMWAAIILSNLFKRLHDKNQLLQSQALELCQARDEAYAAVQTKSRFLANVSHELRTPLTAILGFSENMLDSDTLDKANNTSIQTIVRNGNHLLHLINELLDLSKIEADKFHVQSIDFSIMHLLQDVEQLMSQQAEDKGLEFKVNYAWPLPITIKNDPFRIKQILLNLCSNAIKFTQHGYVHINIRCQRNEEQIYIEVIDTGIGIAKEHHKHIFDAFGQADINTALQYGGTGLGLSLSKRLAELMGGTIELSSEPGKGSRFIVTLPTGGALSNIKFVSEMGQHSLSHTVEGKPNYTLLKGHVLVSEDTKDTQLLLSSLLNKFGLKTTVVGNGQQALDMLAHDEFDLILLDIQMPVLDGLQTMQRLQELGYKKPVIALTANTLDEDQKICQEAGFTDYITKPIRFRIFNKILSKYLQQA